MNVTQIVAFSLVATFLIILLKQYKSEYALLATIVASGIILFFSISKLKTIIDLIENLTNKVDVDREFFLILLKVTGIAYLIDFASSTCKDAGESAISSRIEFAGKLVIVTMSIPIITTLIETVTEVI